MTYTKATKLSEVKKLWAEIDPDFDVEKKLDQFVWFGKKFGHPVTRYGALVYLRKFAENNKDNLEILVKSKNYLKGQLKVVTKVTLPENKKIREVESLVYAIEKIGSDMIPSKLYEGKTFEQILLEKVSKQKPFFNFNDLTSTETKTTDMSMFNDNGYTKESIKKRDSFLGTTWCFKQTFSPTVTTEFAEMANKEATRNGVFKAMFAAGQKTSRAFGKLCREVGITEVFDKEKGKNVPNPQYEKAFAAYSDYVKAGGRELTFVLSLDPFDYLSSSWGHSWSSCHTTDPRNVRGIKLTCGSTYSGMKMGGNLSYALDNCTFCSYCLLPEAKDNYETQGKLYRCWMHYHNGLLMQGRVYPQDTDGSADMYSAIRLKFHDIMSEALGYDGGWVKKSGSANDNRGMFCTYGTHYPDYIYIDKCNISYCKTMADRDTVLTVGTDDTVCLKSGTEGCRFDGSLHGGYYNLPTNAEELLKS